MAIKKKHKFSFKKLIYNDKYLIIISILLAIVIWYSTSVNLSPETSKTISVAISNDFSDSPAAQLGIKCYGDETINVDVTISCKKYIVKDITADDIKVYLQTNNVTSTGTQDVPIKVESLDNADFKITSYYPTVYRAYFDIEDKKVMDIDISYPSNDFVEEGYIMGDPLLSEKSVTVMGPKAYLSQVDRLISSVNFDEKINKTQSIDLNLSAVDRNGIPVDYVEAVSKNDTVTLTMPVLKQTVLDVDNSFTGKPKSVNMSDFTVSYSTPSLSAAVLEDANINSLNIGTIDFSSLIVGRQSFAFEIDDSENTILLDSVRRITATVTVPDTYAVKVLKIDNKNVEMSKIPKGYKAELVSLSTANLTVVGKKGIVELLNSSDAQLSIDLSSLSDNFNEGINEVEVNASVDNPKCWVYGKITANVRIYK